MNTLLRFCAITSVCLTAIPLTAQTSTPEQRAAEAAQIAHEHPLMPIGTTAPDFSLKGTDDKTYTLADFSKAKVLVVMFESVHCPVSENYEGRMQELYKAYHTKDVAFVGINPNNPSAVRLDELGYTDLTDSPADMKVRVKDRSIPWPYLTDGETQSTAQKFGAVATPHVFIFDADRKLRYEGRIDDNQNEALVKVHDAHDAIEALLTGGQIQVPHRPAFGCSTKWISKSADVKREADRIAAAPVSLTPATAADVSQVRANAGDKVTVVHFWNTNAKNYAQDFSTLQTTYWMYKGRSYNYVTVNTNAASDAEKVTSFLKDQHAANTNLQVSSSDIVAISKSFGDSWKPGEEYTAVIAPGGKVVYAHKGPIDLLEVRHAVLKNFTDNPHYPGQSQYWAELKTK